MKLYYCEYFKEFIHKGEYYLWSGFLVESDLGTFFTRGEFDSVIYLDVKSFKEQAKMIGVKHLKIVELE